MREFVEGKVQALGLETSVNVVDVENIVEECSKGNLSKSRGMVALYDYGFGIGDVRDLLNEGDVRCTYNFVYNVVSSKRELRQKKDDETSKSSEIRRLYNEGLSISEIGEQLYKLGHGYVNSNFINSVVRKARNKAKKK